MGLEVHSSGHREFIENFLDDCLAGLLFGFRLIGDGDAVAEHVHANAFDVLRGDIAAATEEREGFGGEGQRNGGAGGGAELNEFFDLDFVDFRLAGGANEIDNVVLHFVVHVNLVDDLAGIEDVFGIDDGSGCRSAVSAGHEIEDLPFLGAGGVADF